MSNPKKHLIRDISFILLSLIFSFWLLQSGLLDKILQSTSEVKLLGAFVAGIFFASLFTVAPATLVLGEMMYYDSIFPIALMGGLGALVGDALIFYFVKDSLSQDFQYISKGSHFHTFFSFFRKKLFRWLIPVVGALIVASPLPDEIGLAMMGLSKMKKSVFIPLAFSLNFAGILAIGILGKATFG